MDQVEMMEICRRIDNVCFKLDEGMARTSKASEAIWGKLQVLEFIVDNTAFNSARKKINQLEAKIKSLERKLAGMEDNGNKFKEENIALKEENKALKKENGEQSQTISEQLWKIVFLEEEKTKREKRWNAYKDDVLSEDIYRDIQSGMSITKVAEKYGVSRGTVRNRRKEYEQYIEEQKGSK